MAHTHVNNVTNAIQSQPTPAEIKANYVDDTNNSAGLYGRPLELGRIFGLLVLMVDTLQKAAAAQANRLNFLSQWQKAYTDEMNQIHAFVQGNSDGEADADQGKIVLDSNDDNSTKIRGDLNTLNTNLTQQMQGNRQVVADDAQALQSSVNQTNDAVQSQTDMATSILQQLSTILSSLYTSSG